LAAPQGPMYPRSLEIFYAESKAAREVIDAMLGRYRTNTTAALALATGAATFFGLSNSPKGVFFVAALAAYGIAALAAIAIYWPAQTLVNVAYGVADRMKKSPPYAPEKLQWDLALGHQEAIAQSIDRIKGWHGLAVKFGVLLFATALVVIFAGTNGYLESRKPTTTNPTHMVMDSTTKPSH
jgi:hypothetical protein